MNNIFSVVCSLLLVLQSTSARAPATPQNSPVPSSKTLVEACQQPCLEDGTPVRLRIAQTVSSADAHVNDRVEFEVLEDIKVLGVLVINKGGIAWGTVTEAQRQNDAWPVAGNWICVQHTAEIGLIGSFGAGHHETPILRPPH